MISRVALFSALALLSACATDTWIPVRTVERAPVNREDVEYLDSAPKRAHTAIGIITPGAVTTEAAAVKRIRKQAARHGADAFYIESSIAEGPWVRVRAKAIVWK